MHVFACSCTRAILLYLQPTVISQLFYATLTYGGRGVKPVLYNFRGSEVLLYNVIWGRGFSKNQHFCVI